MLRMFQKGDERDEVIKKMSQAAQGGNLKKFVLREAAELIAPIFWVTSGTKLVEAGKDLFKFALGAAGFFMVFHGLLTGVSFTWLLIFEIPLAIFGLLLALIAVFK